MKGVLLARPLSGLLVAVLCLSIVAVPAAVRASDGPPPEPPEPVFRITGGGNAHGVGMSQRGARGRALAGHTYQEILAFYYSNHPLATLDTSAIDIRVLLATETTPTDDKPVRITARLGSWTSELFETYPQPFPVNSYLDVVSDGAGGWLARVRAGEGELDSAALVSAVVMEPAEAVTQFEMNYRDNIPRHNMNRGRMRVRVMGSGLLQTVNILNLETYLRGVVPCEMPSSYPVEALRAQAIASRGYAMTKIKTTGWFDIHSYSINQTYGGVKCETTKTSKAVADTAGAIVLTNKGGPAETIFHDTAGGATESSEYAWPSDTGVPGKKKSFQKGRIDVDPNGVPYEAGAPSLYWEAGEVTLSELSAILAQANKTDVGVLSSFEFKRGVSGRVYQAILTGTAGTKYVSGAIFKNVYNKYTTGPTLRSTLFRFEQINEPASPSVPHNLQAVARPGRYVDLSWDASTGVGPITYRVFRDGTGSASRIATALTATSFTDRPAAGTHDYTVRARDAAGNLSDHSLKVTVAVADSTIVDTTPPVVSKPRVTLRSGVTVGTGSTPIRTRSSFTANDPSGISKTQLQRRTNTGSYSNVSLSSSTATAVNINYATHNTTTRQIRARATDKAGNVSSWSAGDAFRVLVRHDGASAVTQKGSWTRATHSGFYGGSVRRSANAGARQSWTATVSSFGVVSTRGPNRGRAEVWVDGVRAATIDLYASSVRRRQVVYTVDFGSAAKHTIELRVSGTKNSKSSGRRVDFDAFIAIAR